MLALKLTVARNVLKLLMESLPMEVHLNRRSSSKVQQSKDVFIQSGLTVLRK